MKNEIIAANSTPQTRLAFCNETILFKGKIEEQFLELGRRLMIIRDNNLFADNWDTFEDYVIEFKNISPATASKLINIFRVFIVDYNVPVAQLVAAGGWTMLAETLPLIKSKNDALEWLHKAATLTRTDLRREIMEAETGKLQKDCEHKNRAYIAVCLDGCGFKERMNELPKDVKKRQLAKK